MGHWIDYRRPDGKTAKGYLATPAKKDAPGVHGAPAAPGVQGVVVVQEYWGLGSSKSHIKDTVDRLAGAGFVALAPDLFHGAHAETPETAQTLMKGLDYAAAVGQDVRGALQSLKTGGAPKTAVVGFCMGGAISLLSSLLLPEVDAGVCFYGIPPADAGDPGHIKKPLLLHFANQDEWCSPAVVNTLAAKLTVGHVRHELHRYDAQHAFMNHHRPEVYAPAAAQLAWDRTVEFLGKTLGV